MRKFNVAVVGATGAVGEELFRDKHGCDPRKFDRKRAFRL